MIEKKKHSTSLYTQLQKRATVNFMQFQIPYLFQHAHFLRRTGNSPSRTNYCPTGSGVHHKHT